MLQAGHITKRQWRDPRIPPDEECVLRALFERWTSIQPDKVFVVSADGVERTYAQFRSDVVRTANALRELGVGQGEHVLCWLPNSLVALRIWFAVNYLGAVFVPINTAYKGALLEHVVENSDARLMIGHCELVPRLEGCALAKLETVVSVGGPAAHSRLAILAETALDHPSETLPELERPVAPWDTAAILYTSGTTGKSKGVLSSYLHQAATGSVESWPVLGRSDRFMVCLPIFHTGATCFIYAMLIRGGSLTIVESFRTADFWPLVNATRSTTTILLGVMAQFLLKEPPAASDRENALQTAIIIPLAQDNAVFAQRFDVGVYTAFNMTEICVPLVSGLNPSNVTSCGKPRPSVQVRLVDENDCEAQVGTPGELIVRTDAPWSLNSGYQKNPEATAKAWRNGWFHTGDVFRKDEHGYYYFVDRLKDTIRRRGENISSYEIESEVLAFSAVREAAVVPVPSEFGEDEILVAVSTAPGQRIEPAALVTFLADRVPYYMVPRYVRVLADLPRTESLKIHKSVLRSAGITVDCWDREQDPSIRIKREQFSVSPRRHD
ncbi:MAG TPA: AMP-binding protein [Rhodoblastus sp.]|nr:AMP-binding protein [Rhodoblastus sp.]